MSNKRLFILFMLGVCLIGVFLGRLVYLQIIKHDFFRQKSLGQLTKVIKIQSHRGNIYDRDGHVLAMSSEAYSIYVTPPKIKEKRRFSEQIAPIIGLTASEIYKKINVGYPFVWLKRRVSPEISKKLSGLAIDGLGSIQEEKREYPQGSLASDILGFVGVDGGLGGLEYQHDTTLKGSPAQIIIEGDPSGFRLITSKKDVRGKPKGFKQGLRHIEPASFDGGHIYTTIDSFIQYTAEKYLSRRVQEMGAKTGQVIVMDPETGEILALADYPSFDPNVFYKYSNETLKNSSVVDVFEPGSIFKIVTLAAALEEQFVTPNTVMEVPETTILSGRLIRESHPRDEDDNRGDHRTVSDILAESLNVGTTLMALELGESKMYKYMTRFGFGSTYNMGLPGESPGLLRHYKDWSSVDIGMVSFGQGVGVTSLQMITAASAVANGGWLPQPKVIDYFSDYEGVTVRAVPKRMIRRVMSEKTAEDLREMMEGVVENGTGTMVRIPGYRIAGKTGTAQVAGRGSKGYIKGEYVASFMGMFPAQKPRYVILVSIHSPKKYISGGVVSGPVFKNIALELIHYFHIKPDKKLIDS